MNQPTSQLESSSEISPSKPIDVLIVDDTPENLRLLSTMLIRRGYSVRKAINGSMALTAAQALPPDLILLDIMMPLMDGYEVCQQLKANPKTAEIPIIFLSALDDVFDKVQAFSVGGADYISKPFHLEEVLARVRHQLALRAAQQEIKQLNAQLEERIRERTHQLELANARLVEMAMHDSLTKLPNRVALFEHLENALQRVHADVNAQFAVLLLDCDGFKVINDSLGHLAGDELLTAISRRLQRVIKSSDCLARLGGDEFAVCLTSASDVAGATRVAERIQSVLAEPFQLKDRHVFTTASIGIVIGTNQYQRPEHLLRDADTAMYRAKAMGKARWQLFDPELHKTALDRLHLETNLRQALAQNEFDVHYQPIVSLATGSICGFEALIRWHHASEGMISPAVFIPIAEESGLIADIGYWVLRQACIQLREWQQHAIMPDNLTISVNLSARQFGQPNLIGQIDKILAETQLDPRCLKLEITESAIVDNPNAATKILQQLRKRHIQLSIDDFGTGYSSLSYLHSFPVDNLKIDRSFVQRLDENSDGRGLVPAIISIAQTMEMSVTAEGIETAVQLTHLRELGCQFGQGFLFSKPLTADETAGLFSTKPQW